MSYVRFVGPIAVSVGLWGVSLNPAFADAIDGTWCAVDGRIMEIHGSQISTPGGNDIIGAYNRHAFSYVVPQSESPAGETVRMVLMSDDIVHLKVGDPDGEAEVWQRCETVS
jgi:hypothetical protein